MIDRYSFLDIEELTEQGGHIREVSRATREGKEAPLGESETESERREEAAEGSDTGGASGRKNRAKVSSN